MAYSVAVIGTESEAGAGADLTFNLPAGDLTGKLILAVGGCSGNGNAAPSITESYVLLGNPAAGDGVALWGKIGVGSDAAPVAQEWAGAQSSTGFMVALDPPAGRAWPAIGVIQAKAFTESAPSAATTTRFAGHVVDATGNCLFRVTMKNGSMSTTPTGVALTSGYTAAGFANRAAAVLVAAEMLTAETTFGSDAVDTDAVVSPGSDSTNRAGMTFEFESVANNPTGNIDTDLIAQGDVNTRAQVGNTFYDHEGAASLAATGSPAVDVSQLFGALDFDGSSQYVVASRPTAISAAFADSDFTMSCRFLADDVNPGTEQFIFGFFNAASAAYVGFSQQATSGDLIATFDAPSGTDYLGDGATQVDDGKWHVATLRRFGNEFSLWVDNTEIDTDTVAAGTMGTLDQIAIGRRQGTLDDLYFDGKVMWWAVWDAALPDADIQSLYKKLNPFLVDSDGDYVFATAGATLHYGPTGVEASVDQIIMKWLSVNTGNLIPASADINPVEMPATFSVWAWDVSALALLARENITVYLGTNQVIDTFTGGGSTLLDAHTPDVDEQGGGWSLQPVRNGLATPTSGVNVTGGKLVISANNAGGVIDSGLNIMAVKATCEVATLNDVHGIQFCWEDPANRMQVVFNALNQWLELTQRHLGVNYSLATELFTILAATNYVVDVVRTEGGVTVYVNGVVVIPETVLTRAPSSLATKAGLFSFGTGATYPVTFDNFEFNSEVESVTRSLSASDTTVTPGQVITCTVVGAAYGAAISNVTLGGTTASIANATTTAFDLTTPAQAAFAALGTAEGLGWYRNHIIRAENEAEVTVQIVPAVPANFGVSGPIASCVYPLVGQEEGDEIYGVINSGAGTFDPVTCSFVATSTASITIYGYNLTTGLWLEPRVLNGLTVEVEANPPGVDAPVHRPIHKSVTRAIV